MRSRLRVRRALPLAPICGLAAWCWLGVFDDAPHDAASADDAPRSTLRIGAAPTSAARSTGASAAPSGPLNTTTIGGGEGGTRIVIRSPAPQPAVAAPGAPQTTIAPHATSAPRTSAPAASAPPLQIVTPAPTATVTPSIAPSANPPATSTGAAAYTASNPVPTTLPPIIGYTSPYATTPSTVSTTGAAPASATPVAAPSAMTTKTPAPPASPADGIVIGGDGKLDDGLPPEEAPPTSAGPPIAVATDEPTATPPSMTAPLGADPSEAAVSGRAVAGPSDLPKIQPYSSTPSAATPSAGDGPTSSMTSTAPSLGSPEPGKSAREAIADGLPAPETLEAETAAPLATAAPAVKPFVDPTKIPPHKLEPVDFNGVLLGETTLDEVIKSWGQPLAKSGNATDARVKYQIDPFAGVEVSFVGGKATAIVIDLGALFAPVDVAAELGLDLQDAAPVEDVAGKTLGLLFPERGVAFRYEDDTPEPRVAQIGLDRVDARPFVMRAEHRRSTRPSDALADVATALELDPANSRAAYVKALVLNDAGRPREALAAVEQAIKADPKSADFLLMRAGLLADQGLFEAALKDNEAVLAGTQKLPHYQARAWLQRGNLLADGPERDAAQAIDAHTRAVRVAETLFEETRAGLRRDAKQTHILAQIAIAEDIAWGDYQEKEESVRKWLTAAEAQAEAAIADDELSPQLLLKVYEAGLAAAVGAPGAIEPRVWAERLQRGVETALCDCNDPLLRRRLQFEAGLGLYDALQALHAQGDIDNALKFGRTAVEMIQAGREGRDEAPTDAYRFGRLYFRIGSLYAVAKKDHRQAVDWFNRAAPLLERPLPESAAADRGRQGETLVSMGISYWAEGNRERALHLSEIGTQFMQAAVKSGSLDPTAMGVAYSNLAVMHRTMGDEAASRKFYELAARAEPAKATTGTLRR